MTIVEHFDVINPDGTSAGYSLPRDDVHKKGLWHRTVHIWILNSSGQLLLQKRSLSKEVYPGCWDISCAGHLSAGDTSQGGAVRELKEELGIHVEPSELQYLFTVTQHYTSPDMTFVDNELTDVFMLQKDIPIQSFNIDPTEVLDVKYISISEFQKSINNRELGIAPHNEEFKMLFDFLKSKSGWLDFET